MAPSENLDFINTPRLRPLQKQVLFRHTGGDCQKAVYVFGLMVTFCPTPPGGEPEKALQALAHAA